MGDIKVGNVVEMYRHYESACGFRSKNGGKWAHRVETRYGGDARRVKQKARLSVGNETLQRVVTGCGLAPHEELPNTR